MLDLEVVDKIFSRSEGLFSRNMLESIRRYCKRQNVR